jgi:two-component system, sensor histidine kinase and response regulator
VSDVAAHRGPSGRILVAEDNEVSGRVVTAMLQHRGFHVDVVRDGAAAVAAATLTRYDAILMNRRIPLMDGCAATTAIRSLPGATAATPIIALTAATESGDEQRCLDVGMNGYLAKPYTSAGLGAALARWTTAGSADIASGPSVGSGGVDRAQSETTAPMPPPAFDPMAPPALDPSAVLRLQRLADGTGGQLMGELAELFRNQAPPMLESIRDALAAGDIHAAQRAAHSLGGASANLGASDLARLCSELAMSDPSVDTEGLRAAIEAQLLRVLSALDAWERA